MINVFQLLAWMASYVYKDGVLFGIVAVTAAPTVPFMLLLSYTMILTIFDRVDVVMMDDETDDESSGSDGSDWSESEDNWSDVSDEEGELIVNIDIGY